MSYILKLEKPTDLRGREHGLIRGYQSFYDWVINQNTSNLSPVHIKTELHNRLVRLGCTQLEIKDLPEYLDANKGL
tara:strand:- start:698 stop:925 length:228 start_codon:yes stop_codon:yes gene_type:complete